MLYSTDLSLKMYERLSELEDKLLKSETERKLLEAKFQFMADSYKNEEERRMNNLREKYAEFMDDCNDRSRRNDDILKSLQKVENGANAVFAKTERLKKLRCHYDAYLSRANPLWRHPDVLQLQAPDVSATQRAAPWIREPRMNMNMPVARPALLLPGGGAVMLPVDESGMAVHPEMPTNWPPAHQVDSEVRKLRLSESMANAKDAKIISTLGEAGQRMMKELKLIEGDHYSYLAPMQTPRPVFYQSYHLPVYIPPTLSYGSAAICAAPTLGYPIPPTHSLPQTKKEATPVSTEEKAQVVTIEKKDRFEKSKDNNFEIECLAADGNYVEEDDANLSDDEVLVAALGRSQSPFRNDNRDTVTTPEWTHHQQNSAGVYNKPPIRETFEYKDDHLEISTPVGKKIVVAHQKSIEELKAILSFEEDTEQPIVEPQQFTEIDYNVDEDVPEEFTEQNYTEPNHDARYQRDVSRNVILEEDEEEEEEKPVDTGENEWNRSQERNVYSPQNRIQYENVERRDAPKSPQQYAQQFKALNKSPSQANVYADKSVIPARTIERQQSRMALLQQQEPKESRTQNVRNSDNGFVYERKENQMQGQTTPPTTKTLNNEFPNTPNLHGDFNMERDDFIRNDRTDREFHGTNHGYEDNFNQVQSEAYEEPHHVEQFDNYHQPTLPAEEYYDNRPTQPVEEYYDDRSAQPAEEYYDNRREQPIEEYYGDRPTEEYYGEQMNPYAAEGTEQEAPINDYYSQQAENENPYAEHPVENYPQEFYEGEINQQPYSEKQYENVEQSANDEFYGEQQQPDMFPSHDSENAYPQQNIPDELQYQVDNIAVSNQQPLPEDNVNESAPPPRPSILNQLLDTDSESYQVDPAGSAPDDSDFDFSIGKS